MFSRDVDIAQNMLSYIKSYKKDKIKKWNFGQNFQLTFVSFLKLQNLSENIIQKINFLNFMMSMENTKNDWFYYINVLW